MKLAFISLPGLLVLAGYTTKPEAPVPPEVDVTNPASVYYKQKGGSLVTVQTPQSIKSDYELPNGEIIDEWSFWRGDHPTTAK